MMKVMMMIMMTNMMMRMVMMQCEEAVAGNSHAKLYASGR